MSKILVVAEKPSAGKDIARILGVKESKGGYMESDDYIVTWAIGHLIGLKDPEDVDESYKKWSIDSIPLPSDNGLKVKGDGKTQFDVIKRLIARDDIEYLINAGDAGREGLLIQNWIYKMAGNKHEIKILWSSSLTDEAILDAMKHLHSNDEEEFKNLYIEAETRAISDQVYGYNYTRLLTCLYGAGGTVLSYGRCQTPLLNLIVKRDLEYETFKSQPYWNLLLNYEGGFNGSEIGEDGRTIQYLSKEEATAALNDCKGKGATIKSSKCEVKSNKAPALFNLAELQGTMGKKYGYSPDKTLSLAQKLYETHKILSYPRTDSRYLSTDIYNEIAEHIKSCSFGKFKEYIDRIDYSQFTMDKSYFNNNKISDHHALIPTINSRMPDIYDELSDEERNVFDEIVISLIAIFYPAYQYEATEIISGIGNRTFKSSGNTVIDLGFKEVYKILKDVEKEQQDVIPKLNEGDDLTVENIELKEGKTKPLARYNAGNIIKLMGKYKIGTSATSAGIVQSLLNRGFVKMEKNNYISTDLGRQLLKFIPNALKSPEMTINFEEKLQKVNSGEISKGDFIRDIENEIRTNKAEFMKNIPAEKLGGASSIGQCPICGQAVREGKRNWYCSGYNKEPKCSFSIWKEIAGKKISETEAIKLLTKRKSGLIKGFAGKNEKTFDAYLILDDAGKIAFAFPPKKAAPKGGK